MSARVMAEPRCPYCGDKAKLVGGAVIYPHRSDLGGRKFWQCAPCEAYVGTHKNSKQHAPLGRLANAELRKWKKLAHVAFDPIWQRKVKFGEFLKGQARKSAYKWLAGQIGIDAKDCHIGKFDADVCKEVVRVCEADRDD